MLAWCIFVLWGFVFAWEPIFGQSDPFKCRNEPVKWASIVLGAALLGIFLHFLTDPPFRAVFPKDFPNSFSAWIAHTLFAVAFIELFLCYAPLAFFARLFRNQIGVICLTLALNLFILAVKLGSVPTLPPALAVIALVEYRVLVTFAAIRLYRWSGVGAVSFLVVMIQARHLFTLSD